MFVVFGANGRAGSEVAKALLAKGKAVRAVLRRPEQADAWQAAGAEAVIADMGDAAQVAAALEGAAGAFVLNPTPLRGDPFASAEAVGRALAAGLRQAGTGRVVALSSVGAGLAEGTGVIGTLHRMERLLDGTAPALTFLRASYFTETWGEVASVAAETGTLPSFLDPAQAIPMVSTLDIGRVAADLLGEARAGQRIVELAGPGDASADDVAAAFAEALGRPVQAVLIPREARAGILMEAGADEAAAAPLVAMYDAIAAGLLAPQDGTQQRRGTVGLREAVERIVGGA